MPPTYVIYEFNTVLRVLYVDITNASSKRHEKKLSHKLHRADDLIWQSFGSVCHGHLQARSQQLMEEKHLSRRSQAVP